MEDSLRFAGGLFCVFVGDVGGGWCVLLGLFAGEWGLCFDC